MQLIYIKTWLFRNPKNLEISKVNNLRDYSKLFREKKIWIYFMKIFKILNFKKQKNYKKSKQIFEKFFKKRLNFFYQKSLINF